jgi:hypothetical protein
MSAQAKIPKPFPVQFNFAVIVIGYVLTLFAAVAGVVAFPFSMISLILLWIVVGAFFVVSVPIILLADVFLVVGFYRAIMELGRRLFFRQDPAYYRLDCNLSNPVEHQRTFERYSNSE